MLVLFLAVLVVLLIVLPLIGLALWALISVGIVGILIGALARLVLPGRQDIGLLATVVIGWIGSLLGGFLGNHVLHTGHLLTIVAEVAVAAALIAAYSASSRRHVGGPGRRIQRW